MQNITDKKKILRTKIKISINIKEIKNTSVKNYVLNINTLITAQAYLKLSGYSPIVY